MLAKEQSALGFVGNPNCGKTTLFNKLTGLSQKTANWPGVTIEKIEGVIEHDGKKYAAADLPGLYDLSAYTMEEEITRKYLQSENVDMILNIVDASNLERSLYLTLRLLELGKPVILVLNMMDVVKKSGMTIDLEALSAMLGGVRVCPVSARKGTGVEQLLTLLKEPVKPPGRIRYQDEYGYINHIVERCVLGKAKSRDFSDQLDQYLTHPILGFAIFFFIMFLVFLATFTVGDWLKGYWESILGFLFDAAKTSSFYLRLSPWLQSLLADGIFTGVGGVLGFLPNMLILYLALAILEDSGYMARAAYLMDETMGIAGLSGKAFLPMLLGFGCTVPAVMATRVLEDKKERRKAIALLPFVSCSAKLPIYILFADMFFGRRAVFLTFCIYVSGILLAMMLAAVYKHLSSSRESRMLCIEMPDYRLPSIKSAGVYLWQRIREYLVKAGTTIFAASVILWVLLNHGAYGYTSQIQDSFGAAIGQFLVPAFQLTGFGEWQMVLALICGLSAKEVVISSLYILYEIPDLAGGGAGQLLSALAAAGMNQAGAVAFLVFCLLYTPCISAVAAVKKETGSFKWTLGMVLFQLAAAWSGAVLIYQLLSRIL